MLHVAQHKLPVIVLVSVNSPLTQLAVLLSLQSRKSFFPLINVPALPPPFQGELIDQAKRNSTLIKENRTSYAKSGLPSQ